MGVLGPSRFANDRLVYVHCRGGAGLPDVGGGEGADEAGKGVIGKSYSFLLGVPLLLCLGERGDEQVFNVAT